MFLRETLNFTYFFTIEIKVLDPFQLPNLFLRSESKHGLQLKVLLIKSLAVSEQEKVLDFQKFFNTINLQNSQLIQIKIQLLNELVESRIIQNEVELLLKSGKKK